MTEGFLPGVEGDHYLSAWLGTVQPRLDNLSGVGSVWEINKIIDLSNMDDLQPQKKQSPHRVVLIDSQVQVQWSKPAEFRGLGHEASFCMVAERSAPAC